MGRSKYNVSDNTHERTYNGITFDSRMEMQYYRDVVLPLMESGEALNFELQKRYILQPRFIKGMKTVQPITYTADFYIEYADGHCEVIDTKGCPDNVALLKRKMFWYHFPDIQYRWLTFIKKFGGWIEYEQAVKYRKEAKKARIAALEKEQKECPF